MGSVHKENNLIFDGIVRVITELGQELHWPDTKSRGLTPQTSLDKNLALDSLSRVELAARIERYFGIILGEQIFLKIETLDDLCEAVARAPEFENRFVSKLHAYQIDTPSDTTSLRIPTEAESLTEVLKIHATNAPHRIHLVFIRSNNEVDELTYQDLLERSKTVAAALMDRGVKKGESVGIMLPTSAEYFYAFMGTIFAGGVPVALYPPARPSQLLDHLERHAEILRNSGARLLITDRKEFGNVSALLKIGSTLVNILDAKRDLLGFSKSAEVSAKSNDWAFIQYTSGSTGSPKGVILSHTNILSNIRAMGSVLKATPKDVFVSWLPLYHDMGLIGGWLGSLYFGCRFVVMSPFSFLSRPIFWLECIQHFGGTLAAAPNFAFELCLRHITQAEVAGLDLSSLRSICNGAEAVDAGTVDRFNNYFRQGRLSEKALLPVYGLAESTVGLAFPEVGSGARIDVILRDEFEKYGRAVQTKQNIGGFIRFVSSGKPLPGHEIRIVDEVGYEVSDRNEGRIQFRGPSSTIGYLNKPKETKKLFSAGWLETGDLGYMAGGELYVTGRIKDVIKHAGRNVHPEEIEMIVGRVAGIRKGCVAAFGSSKGQTGTEQLVVVAETREQNLGRLKSIVDDINKKVADTMGSAPELIKLVRPHTLLKTSSGKIRRSSCKELFESGRLETSQGNWKLNLIRFTLSSLSRRIKIRLQAYYAIVRSVMVWLAVIFLTLVFWPMMVMAPTFYVRWFFARLLAKMVLFVANVRLTVTGTQQKEQAIFVSNHASYTDVVFILAAFPWPVVFLAKAELKRYLPIKFTLDRLRVLYIERHIVASSLQDAKATTDIARKGYSLMSFPEGTFTRASGVLPFHLGAFITSADVEVPIVPVAINGSRSVLHPGSWILRPGVVNVTIGDSINPHGRVMSAKDDLWARAIYLRDEARTQITKYCGEPDLDHS